MVPPHLAGRLRQFSLQALDDEFGEQQRDDGFEDWSSWADGASQAGSPWGADWGDGEGGALLNEWGGAVDQSAKGPEGASMQGRQRVGGRKKAVAASYQ